MMVTNFAYANNDRAAHQPSDRVSHCAQFSDEVIRAICAHTAVLIYALDEGTNALCVQFEDNDAEEVICEGADNKPCCRPLQRFEGEPLLAHAIRCAREAGVSDIYVLFDEASQSSLELQQIASEQHVNAMPMDKAWERAFSLERCCFNLFDLPIGVLHGAQRCLSACPDADSIMIMTCDQVRLQPDHLAQLVTQLHKDPNTDAVASWITWLRRPPYVLRRSFLEDIENSYLCIAGANGIDRPLPQLHVRDFVFGEEKLAANDAGDPSLQAFEACVPMAARRAVAAARQQQSSDKQQDVLQKKQNEADSLLQDIACSCLAQSQARAMAEGYDLELEWADCWAKRNRVDFPLLNDRQHRDTFAYLDSSATAQRPASVLQAMEDFDKHENANVYRGSYDLSMQATFSMNDARKKLEDFIGSERRQTVYTSNTTDAINLVALAWGSHHVHEGDTIVTTLAEHHSNFMPWMLLANRTGAHLEIVGLNGDGTIDEQHFEYALATNPKIVALSALSNVLGIQNPIKSLAERAHRAGARVLIDAAQGLPHLGIDVAEMGADWVAFSAHKIYGPLGIGGLWISPKVFDEMDPIACGGGAISHVSVDSYYLRPKAIQYELGTPAISQSIGFGAAIDYVSACGWDAIHRHEQVMTRYLVDGLHAIEGVTVWGNHDNPEGRCGVVCFSLLGVSPAKAALFLGSLQVAIRAGGHCALPLHASMGLTGSCRASMGIYTTKEDIDALLAALNVLAHLKRFGFNEQEENDDR